MKRIRVVTLLLLCAMTLLSCAPRLVPPEADLTQPYKECWPGTITALSSGSLTLKVKDHAPMTFTLVAGTEYLRLYADTSETVTLLEKLHRTKETLPGSLRSSVLVMEIISYMACGAML